MPHKLFVRRPLEDNLPQNYSPGDALRRWHERRAQASGLRAVETASLPDNIGVGGLTIFSDGTRAFWTDGRSSRTVLKMPDGSIKITNMLEQSPYNDIFRGEDYGTIRDMTEPEIQEWIEAKQNMHGKMAQLSGIPDDIVPELDSRQMTDWQRWDIQGVDTCVGCGREGQLGESDICPRCEQGFNGFDKIIGRQAQVMPPPGGPINPRVNVRGFNVEVVDLDGSPEGGNLAFDYTFNLPDGSNVTHQSPDGWNNIVLLNGDEVDDVTRAQISEQVGVEELNSFADEVFAAYLLANGATEDQVNDWFALEGNYTVQNGRIVSLDEPDNGSPPDGSPPDGTPPPSDDPGFDVEGQRMSPPEGAELDENGWFFEHAITGKSRWIKSMGDTVLEVAQAKPDSISISVLSKGDNKIIHREMTRGVGGNAMEHAKMYAETLMTAMFGPPDSVIDEANNINKLVDEADDNLAALRRERIAKVAHPVWSVAGGVLERKVPEHKEADSEQDGDAMGMPQAQSMMATASIEKEAAPGTLETEASFTASDGTELVVGFEFDRDGIYIIYVKDENGQPRNEYDEEINQAVSRGDFEDAAREAVDDFNGRAQAWGDDAYDRRRDDMLTDGPRTYDDVDDGY